MLADRLGDALAAFEAGGQELVGVGPVDGGTGWAAGLPAGAAGLEQHPVWLPLGVVDLPDLPGLPVGVLDPAGQADRNEAYATRLLDALNSGPAAIRAHDGLSLLRT
jgi:hypothetical protein